MTVLAIPSSPSVSWRTQLLLSHMLSLLERRGLHGRLLPLPAFLPMRWFAPMRRCPASNAR